MSDHRERAPWEHDALCEVFGVSLAPTTDSARVYVPEVAAELADGGQARTWHADEALISTATADRVLVARLETAGAPETSFDYLIGAWMRCRRAEIARGAAAGPVLAPVRSLITGYIGLVIQMPDMFPRDSKDGISISPRSLVPSLLRLSAFESFSETPGGWASVPVDEAKQFFVDLVERFLPGDGFEEVVGGSLHQLAQCVVRGEPAFAPESADEPMPPAVPPGTPPVLAALMQMNPAMQPKEGFSIATVEWRPYMMAMSVAISYPVVAVHLPLLTSFSPNAGAPSIEREALLGPLLRLSCLPDAYPSVAQDQFGDDIAQTQAAQNMDSLRLALDVVQAENFRMWNAMVRAGAAPRERVLDMWAQVCRLNQKRAGMHVNPLECSSDAFMVNMTDLMVRFCCPFIDADASKIDRIDGSYMRHERRWDTRNFTRICASESEAAVWLDGAEQGRSFNFTTEIFFLAARYIALGVAPVMRRAEERDKERQRMSDRLKELEAAKSTWVNTPLMQHYEAMTKRLSAQLKRLKSETLAVHTVLVDKGFLERQLAFTTFMMTWLVRMAEPRSAHPQQPVALPLPAEVPEHFRMLPEHLFDDVCDVILFYARRRPDLMDQTTARSITIFCTVFLLSTQYVRNPFLKAKVAEVLAFCVMPYGNATQGLIGDVINMHPIALEFLAPGLVTFWIEAESTGASTQFYDKFNIRYHLSLVFKMIWDTPAHAKRLRREADEQPARFVVFINRLMNDVTYLVDDALEKLIELHDAEVAQENPEWQQEQGREQRDAHDSRMHTVGMQARSDLVLGTAFLDQLIRFAGETPEAFMTTEIVDRLAAMLDYNLDTLVGPRCQGLRLRQPEAVGFRPRELLKRILLVYSNLAHCSEFPRAIARDGRSYRASLFERAIQVSERHSLLPRSILDDLQSLVERAEAARQADADEEEDLGEIPDDYLDPVMATLMRDPVVLPSSRKVVDRSTIRAHLLNDGTDPFNRMPLKLEDVRPAVELHAEIEAWLAERRAAASR